MGGSSLCHLRSIDFLAIDDWPSPGDFLAIDGWPSPGDFLACCSAYFIAARAFSQAVSESTQVWYATQ